MSKRAAAEPQDLSPEELLDILEKDPDMAELIKILGRDKDRQALIKHWEMLGRYAVGVMRANHDKL